MTTGRLQIVEPMAISAVTNTNGGTGTANVLTPDPKQVFTGVNGTAHTFHVDLGSARTVDSFYAGGIEGSQGTNPAATLAILQGTGANGAGNAIISAAATMRPGDAVNPRTSHLRKLAAPVTGRYFSFAFDVYTLLQLGVLAVGLAFEASWDREWGSGRRPIDTAKVQALIGGGFGVQPGARKASYSWTFGDLTDAEVEQLWGITYRLGQSSPVIVNEVEAASAGTMAKLHYGLFQRFEAFERRDPNATKWALEVEEWV